MVHFSSRQAYALAARSRPRHAGVSSFGIGGTNAHVILEEAPVPNPTEEVAPGSAGSFGENAYCARRRNGELGHALKQHPELNLADVAYTCAVGRRAFEKRRFVVWPGHGGCGRRAGWGHYGANREWFAQRERTRRSFHVSGTRRPAHRNGS